VGGILQRLWLQPARPPLPFEILADGAGALQHLEVLGDGRRADGKGLRQFTVRSLAAGQACQACQDGTPATSNMVGLHGRR
jgi:hypothetical protein